MPDYSSQIDRLRSKLGHKGGPSNKDLRHKIQRLQGRQYFYDQAHQAPTPIPYDSGYDTTVATTTDDLNQQTADIAARRASLSQQYGIGDTSNPYSLARQLETQYKQNTAGTNNSYAASGQLYAGSLQNAQNTNRTNYSQSQDQLLRDYQARQAQLDQELLGDQRTARDTIQGAATKRLEGALNTPVDPSTAPAPPQAAQALLKRLRQRAQKQTQQGHDNRAQKIRDRLARLSQYA